MALIINELVTNAAKYAYPDRSGGPIRVRLVPEGSDAVLVSVRDEGVGLPVGFDLTKSKRLGTRLVTALAKQLNAALTQPPVDAGVEFALRVPLGTVATA